MDRNNMAHKQLRKLWKEMRDRLDPELLIDELFQNKVIQFDDLETIRGENTRWKKAIKLLEKMMTTSYTEIRQFAELLQRTEGIRDLGDRLVDALLSETVQDDD